MDRLIWQFSAEGVVGEPLDLLAEAIRVYPLDRTDELRVKDPPALLQQGAVRDLVGERVLEGVLELGEYAGLVEELGDPEPVEASTERLVR
jgi:hypothetical protein